MLLVEDHAILRQGLRALLEQEPEMQVVGEAADGRDAVVLAAELQPEVVVMDVGLPRLMGDEATRQIVAARPEVKVIGLSMAGDSRSIARMLRAGAKGYLLKESSFEDLAKAIRTVIDGKAYLGAQVTDVVMTEYLARLDADPSPAPILSSREREVLQLLAEGGSTKAIAEALFISVKTVESHRARIMAKVKVSSIAELTKYAIREGLSSLDS